MSNNVSADIDSISAMKRMPALFAGHGSPMNAIEDSIYSAEWDRLARELPRPKAILSVSAHWYTDGSHINDAAQPQTVYDMYGFPQELYDVTYPAPGSPDLAHRVQQLLEHPVEGAPRPVAIDNSWGLDHGTWSILHRMFPQADIPIVQLSVASDASAEQHFQIGRQLSPLRDEGVMIFGSGDVVHNLALVDWSMKNGYPWADEFDAYIKERIAARDFSHVIDYRSAGTCADKAFWTPEHFLPLLYVLGASSEADSLEVFNDSCELGAISMTGYLFR